MVLLAVLMICVFRLVPHPQQKAAMVSTITAIESLMRVVIVWIQLPRHVVHQMYESVPMDLRHVSDELGEHVLAI